MIWPTEVPFFLSQRWALLSKVSVFRIIFLRSNFFSLVFLCIDPVASGVSPRFFSLGPRPILYFNCICSWLVNNLEVSFWPTSISNIYEVYRCYIYIFTKPHPVELSFSGQLPSLTFAWRPSLILITWRLQCLCACCFPPPCLHLLLFYQLIISTLKVTHLKSGKRQCNFWTIHCFLLKKGLKYPVLLSVSGIRPSDWAPRHCCSESAVGKGEPPGGITCQ